MHFPFYVKYSNQKHFFKIINASEFEELTIFPSAFSVHRFKAKTFVDRNLIADMLSLKNGVLVSSEKEFTEVLSEAKEKGHKQLA